MHTKPWLHWTLVGMATLSLIFVIINLFLGHSIRSTQAEVNQRQQFINQSIRLNRINEGLIRLIAQTSISDNDDKLRDVLTRNGITVNRSSNPSGAPATPSPAPALAPGSSSAPSNPPK